MNKVHKNLYIFVTILIVVIVSFLLISKSLKVTNTPLGECRLIKKSFSIKDFSFNEIGCNSKTYQDPRYYREDSNGNVQMLRKDDNTQVLVIEILDKEASKEPFELLRESYFNKLNQRQTEQCEIREIGTTKENTMRKDLKKDIHKTRYEIVPKKEVVKILIDKYDGLAPNSEQDYICGKLVGSPLDVSSPYFEFDDRSPSKYLFIHLTWNDDGPNIDLSSFKF